MRFLNFVMLISATLFLPITGCEEPAEVQVTAELAPTAVYDQAVPESETVDDDWFSNTAMIGHSMMRGVEAYSGLETPDYYTLSGSSVSELLYSDEVSRPDGTQGTLSGALAGKTYERFYLFMGINEVCGDLTELKEDYRQLIELVRSSSPDTPVYVLSVLPVTRSRDGQGTFTLARIERYNAMLLELCGEESCWYVDLSHDFTDDVGYLPSEFSSDGIHLKQEQYVTLVDLLKTHTVD